jgi:hypothetical protein
MHPVLAEIRERYPEQVRIVMRYATFHDGSDIAVRILETARLQGLFEPVLEALLGYATTLGRSFRCKAICRLGGCGKRRP